MSTVEITPQPTDALVVHSTAGSGDVQATPELLAGVGYADETTRSTTSVMVDHHYSAMTSHDPGIEVMPLADALVTYPWVQELMFSLIDPEQDSVLRRAFESTHRPFGTFTWVHDGAKVELPAQSFTVMTVPQERQFVHDITVIGAGAEVSFVSGSAVSPNLTHGRHVSVSETFIGAGAKVRSLEVERWGRHMNVRSYNRMRLERGAASSSVSVAVSGIDNHVSDSKVSVAEDAVCSSHSVVFAPEGTHREIVSVIDLLGAGAQAEQVARMVSDGGDIRHLTTLAGRAPGSRGFLQCDGLMLRESGSIDSVPALIAATAQAQLSHEASVGMIDSERLGYLMASGLGEDAARDLIVQGFLDLDDQQIPVGLRDRVAELVSAAREAEL